MKRIKVTKPDGTTNFYQGDYDVTTRTATVNGKKIIAFSHHDQVEVDECFVATAIYAGYDAPQVQILRVYRDKVIILSWFFGENFVRFYYYIGPYLAQYIHRFPLLRKPIKQILDMIVEKVRR